MAHDMWAVRELYEQLCDDDVWDDRLLGSWLTAHPEVGDWLADHRRRTERDWTTPLVKDAYSDSEWLYALSRITTHLQLAFQVPLDRHRERPPVVAVSVDEYVLLHKALGFSIVPRRAFHPFYHEISVIVEADDPSAAPAIIEQRWPALMLGDLLYHRAGCVVSAGTRHVSKLIAETSTLWWSHCRLDRAYRDLSHGWGHNSQWGTNHRRDYLRDGQYWYNVDAREDIRSTARAIPADLPVDDGIEVIRYRCRVRSEVEEGLAEGALFCSYWESADDVSAIEPH